MSKLLEKALAIKRGEDVKIVNASKIYIWM